MSIDALTAITEKLVKYEDVEEDGRLIILPCPIGKTVYMVYESTVESAVKTIIHEGKKYRREIPVYLVGETKMSLELLPKWGKTVFAMREEAEMMCQKMREDA